ncbi:MAG: hypothetical protein ACOYMN_15455 [Roseimicrobium sp.]
MGSHNLIALHGAITCGGNDHRIEFNEVHDFLIESDDLNAPGFKKVPSFAAMVAECVPMSFFCLPVILRIIKFFVKAEFVSSRFREANS